MEELLLSLPPFILDAEGDKWFLTVGASTAKDYWLAGYLYPDQGIWYNNFSAEGATPTEALQKVKESMALLKLIQT